ncbi:MAG: ribosome recycling factor [bacterium]|nr:ribosome recycling factor [bacterium]
MSEELIEIVVSEARDRMERAVAHARREFSGVRTGRATSALVERLSVNYHGAEVSLQQIAGFSVPDVQMLVISPYDKRSIEAIQKAIQRADLGFNPSTDGSVVRLHFPPLTEERRRELVRLVRAMAESGRVALRGSRRAARQDLDTLKRDGDISEDDSRRGQRRLDEMTQEFEEQVGAALEAKETELMQV